MHDTSIWDTQERLNMRHCFYLNIIKNLTASSILKMNRIMILFICPKGHQSTFSISSSTWTWGPLLLSLFSTYYYGSIPIFWGRGVCSCSFSSKDCILLCTWIFQLLYWHSWTRSVFLSVIVALDPEYQTPGYFSFLIVLQGLLEFHPWESYMNIPIYQQIQDSLVQ